MDLCYSCSCGGGRNDGRPYLAFYLDVPAPPVNIAGDYTLTFVADSACADLPAEVRTRTYAATITLDSRPNTQANTGFKVEVSGAPFLSPYDFFEIGVAGDYLGLWLWRPLLVEQLAPNTYLAFSGWAAASVGTSAVSKISTSFDGWIDYCARKSATGRYSTAIQARRLHTHGANPRIISSS